MDSSTSGSDSSSTTSSDSDYDVITRKVIGPRSFQERMHCGYYDDVEFKNRFRFTKPSFFYILDLIKNELEFPSNRGSPLSPELQLLIALRFYATGCIQEVSGDLFGVSQPTACRTIHRVSRCLAALRPTYIKMPQISVEIRKVNQEFYNVAGIPRVIGCIDGTHIPITSPGGPTAELYRNRKHFFSINVQAIVDAQYKFCDIVARWHGSAHDMTIFNFSSIKSRFENNDFGNSILLGDGGYGCTNYMITPYRTCDTPAKERFNKAHKSTRTIVERSFGQWKRRFKVVAKATEIALENLLPIIIATAVLFNISKDLNEQYIDLDDEEEEDPVYFNVNEATENTSVRDILTQFL